MTQKKETKASISSEWFQCPCGGWSVVCTRCGRVGERGHTQAEAKAKWDAGLFKYGPLKEDKDK